MITIQGKLCSGQTLRSEPATLEIDGGQVRISADSGTREAAAAQVRISEPLPNGPRFVYLPEKAVFETVDQAGVDALFGNAHGVWRERIVQRIEGNRHFAAVACVLLVIAVALALFYGPSAVARSLAFKIPAEIEANAGTVALAAFDQQFGTSGISHSEAERAKRQLARLFPDRDPRQLPKVFFRSTGKDRPNAFALPGGQIVMADELIRLPITDDELAAVLAHECGHLERRHGLQSVLRNSSALLIVSAATGDLSALTSFAGALPFTILANGYSRDMEREADEYAAAQLKHRGIPTKAFTSLMLKMREARGHASAEPWSYFSTHPDDETRVRLFGALTAAERDAAVREGTHRPIVIYQPRLAYPPWARKQGVEAKDVRVSMVVDEFGQPTEIEAFTTADRSFALAAEAGVGQWRFIPGKERFKTVRTRMMVPVSFTLEP